MSALQVIGALLVALPFLVLAVVAARELGWREVLLVFGASAATLAVVVLGVLLLTGEVG